MYLVVFQNGEFISEIHFCPYCRNLKILGLIEISNIPKAVLRWYYTKEMSFFKIRQTSIILYLSDVEIIADFSSENRFQKYHFFIELRLFTYTDYLEYLKRNYATRTYFNCAVNFFFFNNRKFNYFDLLPILPSQFFSKNACFSHLAENYSATVQQFPLKFSTYFPYVMCEVPMVKEKSRYWIRQAATPSFLDPKLPKPIFRCNSGCGNPNALQKHGHLCLVMMNNE